MKCTALSNIVHVQETYKSLQFLFLNIALCFSFATYFLNVTRNYIKHIPSMPSSKLQECLEKAGEHTLETWQE